MNCKLPLLTLTCALLSTYTSMQLSAQDIDRKRADISYIQLPLKALPADVATYFVSVKSKSTTWGNTLGNVYEAEKIAFNGYYRLKDATDADLLVECEVLNELVFDKAEERLAELLYKRDKNSPTIRYIAYYYNVSYYTPKVRLSIKTREGKLINETDIGGTRVNFDYGSTNYSSYFPNSYSLSSAWRSEKYGLLAKYELAGFQSAINAISLYCQSYCLVPAKVDFAVRYVDEKKGKTIYEDLLQARDYYLEAVSYIANDKIMLINKLVQPDYETRRETMKKAIEIWEKALAEADFENRKARIDAKVGRHLYYNLALAYLWIDDFVKAKEYAQGRKKDVGSWDKNLLSGIRDLSVLIDDRAARMEANKWRKVMLADTNIYVYKDPATRKREHEEFVKAEKARQAAVADSIKMAARSRSNKGKGSGKGAGDSKKTAANQKLKSGTAKAVVKTKAD